MQFGTLKQNAAWHYADTAHALMWRVRHCLPLSFGAFLGGVMLCDPWAKNFEIGEAWTNERLWL